MWGEPTSAVPAQRRGGVMVMDTGGEEPLRGLHFPYVPCALGPLEPVCVWNHVSKVAFCPSPLPTSPSRAQLCSLNSSPWGGERQQMGLGQRPGVSDSQRPGCRVEAASIRKLLFPWESTNHWRKLKMSPLRNAIKSSKKKLQLCRWYAAACSFGC